MSPPCAFSAVISASSAATRSPRYWACCFPVRINAQIRAIELPASAYAEVADGRADVVLASLVDAAEQLSGGSTLRGAPIEPRNANFIGLLVQQGHSELRSYIDAWIRAQECSGYLADLTAKYYLNF